MCLAIPGRIVAVTDEEKRLAKVDVAGVTRTINIGLLDGGEEGGAQPGDWVLIHVGFAMTKLDEEEAASTLEFIKQLGSIYDDEMRDFSAEAPL